MTEWTPDPARRGAAGIEFHGWEGLSRGSDLFHRYAVLGFVTVYRTTTPLYRFLKMMRVARDVLRRQQ
jgi:hypothetical protein